MKASQRDPLPDESRRYEPVFPALALAFKLGVAAVTAAPVAGALVIDQPSSAVLIEPLCATTDPVRFPCPVGVPTLELDSDGVWRTYSPPTEDSPGWDCRYHGNGVCGVGHDPDHPDSWTVDGVPVNAEAGQCLARERSGLPAGDCAALYEATEPYGPPVTVVCPVSDRHPYGYSAEMLESEAALWLSFTPELAACVVNR